jgi:hypothetical protein
MSPAPGPSNDRPTRFRPADFDLSVAGRTGPARDCTAPRYVRAAGDARTRTSGLPPHVAFLPPIPAKAPAGLRCSAREMAAPCAGRPRGCSKSPAPEFQRVPPGGFDQGGCAAARDFASHSRNSGA